MTTSTDHRAVLDDHDRRPRHYGLQDRFDVEVRADNPVCGDRVVLRLAMDGTRVDRVSFESLGCSISRAATSVMTELVVGGTLTEALDARERFSRLLVGHPGPDATAGATASATAGATASPRLEAWQDAGAFTGAARFPSRVRCALLGWTALVDACAGAEARAGTAMLLAPSPRRGGR